MKISGFETFQKIIPCGAFVCVCVGGGIYRWNICAYIDGINIYICAYTVCLHFYRTIYVEQQYTHPGDTKQQAPGGQMLGKNISHRISRWRICVRNIGKPCSLMINHLSEKEIQIDQNFCVLTQPDTREAGDIINIYLKSLNNTSSLVQLYCYAVPFSPSKTK